MLGGELKTFDWSGLVSRIVHPIKVAIIEAIDWIDEPLSAAELTRLLTGEFDLSLVSYHVRSLAKSGVVRDVRHRQVRGAQETYYFFTGRPYDRRRLYERGA